MPDPSSYEFCKLSKNTFPYKTPPVPASVSTIYGIIQLIQGGNFSRIRHFMYKKGTKVDPNLFDPIK